MNEIISIAVFLLLIMDPLGNLPIFMSVLKYTERKRQKLIIIRELLIALGLMFIFLFFGDKILKYLNLSIEAVSISSSIILFLIAIKMIFPKDSIKNRLPTDQEPFIFPLAVPLIAGPTTLSSIILLSHQHVNQISHLLVAMLLAWFVSFTILLQSAFFLRKLGEKGVNVMERLMGLVLVMIATQMFLDGIRTWIYP